MSSFKWYIQNFSIYFDDLASLGPFTKPSQQSAYIRIPKDLHEIHPKIVKKSDSDIGSDFGYVFDYKKSDYSDASKIAGFVSDS